MFLFSISSCVSIYVLLVVDCVCMTCVQEEEEERGEEWRWEGYSSDDTAKLEAVHGEYEYIRRKWEVEEEG